MRLLPTPQPGEFLSYRMIGEDYVREPAYRKKCLAILCFFFGIPTMLGSPTFLSSGIPHPISGFLCYFGMSAVVTAVGIWAVVKCRQIKADLPQLNTWECRCVGIRKVSASGEFAVKGLFQDASGTQREYVLPELKQEYSEKAEQIYAAALMNQDCYLIFPAGKYEPFLLILKRQWEPVPGGFIGKTAT